MKQKPFNSGTFTHSQFFNWLRVVLRRASLRWRPRREALVKARRQRSDTPRKAFEYKCSFCQQWFREKEVEADHIIPVGSLTSFDDLPGFVARLFVEADGYQCVCKKCHKGKTHAKNNSGMEPRR